MGLLGAFIGRGDNRGKVLEALKHPIISKKVETFKYGRKGSAHEGLVIEHVTKVKEFTVGDLLALTVAGGMLYIASEGPIRDFLRDMFDPLGALPESLTFNMIADALKEAIDPLDLFAD